MNKNIIFFDVETNGKIGSSVLSISAIKVNYNFDTDKWIKISEYDRFYFRNEGEPIDFGAINVHGLTDEMITEKRQGVNYPATFKEDMDDFFLYCQDTSHFVAHNIRFDRSFISFPLKNQFDTMMENVDIVKAGINENYGTYKWPKLIECAKFYNVPMEEEQLHESLYDVLITFRIFYKMTKNPFGKPKIFNFLNKK